MSRQVFVAVTLEVSVEGVVRPLAIVWEDGTRYEITRARPIGIRAAKSAGSGECWLCRISGQDANLYHSAADGRWWMDGKGDPEPLPEVKPYQRVKDRAYRPPGPSKQPADEAGQKVGQ